ncbi:hypothetical protein AB0F81_40005 [Actinoplanes sp. NPDC024001]|uniref:hypothetical protein n=1 Tax=Actinoplanes sp. NPDC024001 TaxID=3154598 RepID=UPI0033F7538B
MEADQAFSSSMSPESAMPVFRAAANEPTAHHPASNAPTYPANQPGYPANHAGYPGNPAAHPGTPPSSGNAAVQPATPHHSGNAGVQQNMPHHTPGPAGHQGSTYSVNAPAQRPASPAPSWTEPSTYAAEPPVPEGPTEPLGASEGRPSKRRGRSAVVLAVLLSLLALLASAGAGMLSWRAFETARSAHDRSSQTAPGTQDDHAASRPAQPEEYPVSYAKEPLHVQVGCAAVLFLDLDEPRADADEKVADLRYDSRCGDEPPRLSLGAGAAAGSQGSSSDLDAPGCQRAIRTSPLGPGADVEVKKGTALCVLTAATPAELVLVEIIDVGGTGTAGLRATSWQVPR